MSGNPRRLAAGRGELDPEEIVRRDAPGRRLLASAVRGLRRGGDPVRRDGGRPHGGVGLVEPARLGQVDAEAVARWIVSRYDDVPAARDRAARDRDRGRFRGVVIGSPHASAVHLALALGVPWLPASFDVAVQDDRPDAGAPDDDGPARVVTSGQRLAGVLAEANPAVAVRQLHDPVRRPGPVDAPVTLRVNWLRVPSAYRRFVAERVTPDAPVVLVRDVSRWLVVRTGDRCGFQFGVRSGGLDALDYYRGGESFRLALRATGNPVPEALDLGAALDGYVEDEGEYGVEPGFVDDLRWRCIADDRRLRQVLYRRPSVFSVAVADLYRRWLRAAGRTGNRLVVECGRLFDPWQVLRAGLVPYWVAHPHLGEVTALEWWLAGSEVFSSVDVLVDPPGRSLPSTAYLAHWASAAAFAGRRGVLDPRCARSYPLGGLPVGHAGDVLAQHPYDLPYLPTLAPDEALDEIASAGETSGLLVL